MNVHDDERLIATVIDDGTGWEELSRRAAVDPDLWRRLSESWRDERELEHLGRCAAKIADAVPAPVGAGHAGFSLPRASAWSGWIVAALVALAWTTGLARPDRATQEAGFVAGPSLAGRTVSNPDEALAAYVDLGRRERSVIGEMPSKLLVESRPTREGGGFEIIFIRQLIERRVVPDLFEFEGNGEQGGPTLVRFRPDASGAM